MAFFGILAALAVLAVVLKLANPLPAQDRTRSDLHAPDVPSALADRAASQTDLHPGKTGVVTLARGVDAFAMRMALARAASRTIDAQYYIWHDDLSGRMLLAELIAAADRGVAVRMLIDDNATAGLDGMWAEVNSHPNITVRLFNPLVIRKVRGLNYLFDFPRLNHRMHNKSITYDGVATIVGGRNIGDEYFGVKEEGLFIDLDLLAIGKVVGDVSDEFETYWDSAASFPAESILPIPSGRNMDTYRNPQFGDEQLAQDYRAATEKEFRDRFLKHETEVFEWVDVRVFSDKPEKALGKVAREDLLMHQVIPLMGSARESVDLVSAYFVPTDEGAELIAGLAKKGVATRVVTNSLQATDVPLVHAGYAPYRKMLLDSGVRLFEIGPEAGPSERRADLAHTRFSGGGSSVHAKTFAVDNKWLFVGSFNFDPRSAYLNCEMGFVIESPEMAAFIPKVLDRDLPHLAYEVTKSEDGSLRWTRQENRKAAVYDTEPGTSAFQRGLVWTMGRFPIEWLL